MNFTISTNNQNWDGNGMPPVGTVCEIAPSTPHLHIKHPEGSVVKIYAHFTDDRGIELAAFVDEIGKVGGVCTSKCFRPLKTQEDKKRELLIETVNGLIDGFMKSSGGDYSKLGAVVVDYLSILRPGITASCAAYLMLYADGSWYHFLSGALAFKSCIETHDIYKEVRDAR